MIQDSLEDEDAIDDPTLPTELSWKHDPTKLSLDNITAAGHAFSIPWNQNVRPILSGFESTKMSTQEGPWVAECPFYIPELQLTTILLDAGGITGSYRDGLSAKSSSYTEHMSAQLGITIGYPFLSASVSGSYDKHVVENNDDIRASRNASCRVGCIVLDKTPRLSLEAKTLLRGTDGLARFQKRYGDFYVCGYRLGADAGASLSATSSVRSSSETLKVTVAVKVLFVKVSKTWTKTKSEYSGSATMRFSGYNTLRNDILELTSGSSSGEQDTLRDHASSYLHKVGSLVDDVRFEVRRLGLRNGQDHALSKCTDICTSGLVVELQLAPFARLNEYIETLLTVA